MPGTAAKVATVLANVWSGLAGLNAGAAPKTHSFLFEVTEISGASYQELLNRLARAPESLRGGTETAVVYYLPAEPGKGYRESSLVLNRSAGIERGLQVTSGLSMLRTTTDDRKIQDAPHQLEALTTAIFTLEIWWR